MQRAKITTLASNADAAAIETARAALTSQSGQAVIAGGRVSFSVEPAAGEQFDSGDMVGFAYVATAIPADGSITTQQWRRWKGGDFSIIQASKGMLHGPLDVPPGASRVISLPQAVVDSGGSTSFACGIFFHAPSTVG